MTIRVLPPADGLHGAIVIGGRNYAGPPSSPSAAAIGSGGTFAAGTYYWKITAIGPWGESSASGEVSATLALNGSCSLAWLPVPGATGYRVYRGTTPGGENAYYSVTGNGYTDTNAGSTAASPPTAYAADMPDDDALFADANGWVAVAKGVGTTVARPVWPRDRAGWSYLDTTLGYVIIWDGQTWRNPATGASV